MTLLIQISDTHFGTERVPVVEALVRMVREQVLTVLVLSGDIAQPAWAAQFSAALRFIDRMRGPVSLVIPGNHDIPLYNVAAWLFRP